MKIALIENGGANFLSIITALNRLNIESFLTHDKELICQADAVILPGVGSAGFAMDSLDKYGLIDTIKTYPKPLLGICLGMQLLYEYSQEDQVECLGIIPSKIAKFNAPDLIIPHMGWNNLEIVKPDPILNGVRAKDDVYFVHSYYAAINQYTIASCNYGVEFSSVIKKDNFYAMQFHPEKSGDVGAMLLKNFIEITNNTVKKEIL